MTAYRHFLLQEQGDIVILELAAPNLFDTLIVGELENELLSYLEDRAPSKLLVDFGGVSHCSTGVINGLLRAKKRLLSHGGQLALCGMSDPIRDAYRMLNLDGTVFMIFEDRAQGLGAMSQVE
jgi:anti-anti-sigma regulatory factor